MSFRYYLINHVVCSVIDFAHNCRFGHGASTKRIWERGQRSDCMNYSMLEHLSRWFSDFGSDDPTSVALVQNAQRFVPIVALELRPVTNRGKN